MTTADHTEYDARFLELIASRRSSSNIRQAEQVSLETSPCGLGGQQRMFHPLWAFLPDAVDALNGIGRFIRIRLRDMGGVEAFFVTLRPGRVG